MPAGSGSSEHKATASLSIQSPRFHNNCVIPITEDKEAPESMMHLCRVFFLLKEYQIKTTILLFIQAATIHIAFSSISFFIGHHFSQKRSFTHMNMTYRWIE